MTTISTIGYEGADVAPFIDTLVEAGVKHVIDIRDVPASRKRGFSKNILSAALSENGIAYTHLKQLGDPKPGREAMRSGNYEVFLKIYNEHVAQPAAQSSLQTAVTIATEEPSVLLCYERDPKHCHRTLVADMMKDLASLSVRHLGVSDKRQSEPGRVHGASAEPAHAIG
jgi:uncharacterized protein (DUF488 family)